jgi:hypothetical protein
MKPEDKDKLNQCLDILDSTDLGLSLVWLWTWSTIKNFMDDVDYKFSVDEDTVWNKLCAAVEDGKGFSLEYGAEQHLEEVQEWLSDEEIMTDVWEEEND